MNDDYQRKEVRRRQRQTLSCLPCRRLKVKCDRNQPCGHCVWSERASSCHYATFPKTVPANAVKDGGHVSPAQSAEPSKTNVLLLPKTQSSSSATSSNADSPISFLQNYDPHDIWNSKFRGPTHWLTVRRQLQVNDMCPKSHEGSSLIGGIHERISNRFSSVLSPNWPLGSGYEGTNMSKAKILSYIPDRPATTIIINNYMETIERLHPLLHVPTFYEELDHFWDNPKAIDDAWLSQFLVMLALGYQSLRDQSMVSFDKDLLLKYLQGAEVCLKNTPFFIVPVLTSLRALSMMALARHILSSSCIESDSCGPLMSTVVRLAMSISLHIDPQHEDSMSVFDMEIRRRLWTTIALMEAQMHMSSGTPFLLRPSDFDTLPPSNVNNDELKPSNFSSLPVRPMSEYTDSTFQIILARCFPASFEILTRVNSPSRRFEYEEVLHYHSQVKNLLQEASQWTISTPPEEWRQLQWFMVEIFLRRVLLVLHSDYGLRPNADVEYPVSYWSTLESSLALLVIQRQMSEDLDSPLGRLWLAEYFKHDFYIAILVICVLLARTNAINRDLAPLDQKIEIPQRETILQTLFCCREIWARRICRTYCQFLSHMNLDTTIARITIPETATVSSADIEHASFRFSVRMLKHCKCGNCPTEPGSLKALFSDHPYYVAA